MSNKRHPGKGQPPWRPGDFTTITNPSTRPRSYAQGWEASVHASIQALETAGASNVVCGYTAPDFDGDPDDAPPGTALLWWFEATYPGRSRRVRGEAGPTCDHGLAILEAAAVILRGAAARVTVIKVDGG